MYLWKKYFVIICITFFGMFSLGSIKKEIHNWAVEATIAQAEERLDLQAECLAVCRLLTDEKMPNNPCVKWWYDEETSQNYLFLPGFFAKEMDLIWVFDSLKKVVIDGKEICSGDRFELEEGMHVVKIGNDVERTFMVLYSGNIASLHIKTEEEALNYIHESKENETSAEYVLMDEVGRINNYGGIESFRCRGNVSFTDASKKSYQLKMYNKSNILGLGEDKDWLLISNVFDSSLSRNKIVNSLADDLEVNYVPDMDYVDLYINGDYMGNYLLSEKIEIGSDRVNIRDLGEMTESLNGEDDLSKYDRVVEDPDKLFSRKWYKIPKEPETLDGGYLLEIELSDRYGVESSGFISSRMQAVVVHSPKYATLNQIGFIADIYQDFEDALFSKDGYNHQTQKYFYEYIDMESFAKKYMIEELTKNLDASYSSFFMYKPEYDSKLYAGPVWDYDKAVGVNMTTNEGIDLRVSEGLYAAIMKKDCDVLYGLYQQPEFRMCVESLCDTIFTDAVDELTDVYIDENMEKIEKSAIMDAYRWGKLEDGNTIEDKIKCFREENSEIKNFLKDRICYLKKEWKL